MWIQNSDTKQCVNLDHICTIEIDKEDYDDPEISEFQILFISYAGSYTTWSYKSESERDNVFEQVRKLIEPTAIYATITQFSLGMNK